MDAIYIHRRESGTGGGDTPNLQPADSRLTFSSLFDGSGGFSLGRLLAGITPLWILGIKLFTFWYCVLRTISHIFIVRYSTANPLAISAIQSDICSTEKQRRYTE